MIKLFKPFMPVLPKLNDIISSDNLAYGEYTKSFEEELKKYFNTPYLIVTNTFNSAISVAITTLGLEYGDEVIMSPMGCLVSTMPYLTSGLKIKWCDIDPKRGTLSPTYLKSIISNKTKLIIHNHFCGYPGYIDEVNEIAKEFGIPVIDDGIECFGSEYKGNKIGNVGTDITVFSLNSVRLPNTIEGGIVIFKNKEYYEKSLLVRDCGIDRTKFRDEIGEINRFCDISQMGFSATMSNINGYIGLNQMKYVESLIDKQRENATKLTKLIDLEIENEIEKGKESNPNYWVYGMLVKEKKETILKYRRLGLYASSVHINNNIYSVFNDDSILPGVKYFSEHFVALPSGWWIEDYECMQK